MTKTTFAFAAALLAGTTLTSAANADAVRVGFGFPLGSFVAHSNESYSGREYRRIERPRTVRRPYKDSTTAKTIAKVKRPARDVETLAAPKEAATAAVQTAKLGSDPVTTTVIEKTPDTTSAPATASVVNTGKNSDAETSEAPKANSQTASAETEGKHICRRYVPAVAALIDVPCE